MAIEVRGSPANVEIVGDGEDMLEAEHRAVFEVFVNEWLNRVAGGCGA